MKLHLFLPIAALGLAACSTTNSNKLNSQHANLDSSSNQVCFYIQRPGWQLKEKHCTSAQAYAKHNASFLPAKSQAVYTNSISVDKLPNSSK